MKLIIDLVTKESTLEASEEVKVPLTSPQLLSVLSDSGILKTALARSMRAAAGKDEDIPKVIKIPPKRSHKKVGSITTLSTVQRNTVKAQKSPRRNPTQENPNSVSGNVRRVIMELMTENLVLPSREIHRLVHERYPEVKKHNPPFVYYTLGRLTDKRILGRLGTKMNFEYCLRENLAKVRKSRGLSASVGSQPPHRRIKEAKDRRKKAADGICSRLKCDNPVRKGSKICEGHFNEMGKVWEANKRVRNGRNGAAVSA